MCRLMSDAFRTALGLVMVSLLAAAGSSASFAAEAPQGSVYKGAAISMGKGTARVVVHTDSRGKPQSVAVEVTDGALEGLPATLNKKTSEGQWEYPLPMPAKGPKTGYSEVVVDWHPHGHPPPHIYTVPHFDFHFYVIAPGKVRQVKFTGPGDAATKVSNAALVPAGYKVIPETAVNEMGVHAIDTSAPEFHGKPFTATFIYGYYKGRLIFLEPMVTRAFLQSKPDFVRPVKTPERYSVKGDYPTQYAVQYDAAGKSYVIKLEGLKHWSGASGSVRK